MTSKSRVLHFLGLAALLLPLTTARGESVSVAELETYLSNLFAFYNERSDLPLPALSTQQIQQLARGESVHLVQRDPRPGAVEEGETVDRVVGIRLLNHARELVWLTALDPDIPISGFFHDVRLESDRMGSSRWWVYLDLPWPVADRHWVADLWKNRELAEAAQGYVWEHRWDLSEGGERVAAGMVHEGRLEGIDAADVATAVYLPVNRGGLVAAAYRDEQTLVVYNLSTVVGGHIPDRVVRAFSRQQVGSFLDMIDRTCESVYAHYGPDHERIFDGLGAPMASRSSGSADHHETTDDP
jgi:hypothetical protein